MWYILAEYSNGAWHQRWVTKSANDDICLPLGWESSNPVAVIGTHESFNHDKAQFELKYCRETSPDMLTELKSKWMMI